MKVEPKTREKVILNYPGLEFKEFDGKITLEGIFGFKATFNSNNNQYIINPQVEDDYTIIDRYQVTLNIPETDDFPTVFETAGRIPKESDFHKNKDGSLCLAGPFDSIDDFPLDKFLDILLLQFLYDQSFNGKFKFWPRGEYSHGPLGLIENYYDRLGQISQLEEQCFAVFLKYKDNNEYQQYFKLIVSKKRVKGHHPCVCGSGTQYRQCHNKVFRGLWTLQEYILRKQDRKD